MTARATFGDFASAASAHLDIAISAPRLAAGRQDAAFQVIDADDVTRSLHGVVTVLARYCGDISAASGDVPARDRHLLTPWTRASIRAQEALQNAVTLLQPGPPGTGPAARHARRDSPPAASTPLPRH